MAAAFNLQKFPGFKGTGFHVQLTDASGLHKGNMVQIAGVRVGRVDALHIGRGHVTVDFDVKGAKMGEQTQASVQVLNLLGEKYLEVTPKGSGEMKGGDTIPVSRTNGSYDIVSTLSELTTTTEAIDIPRLSQALTTLGDTLNAASPHIQSTLHRPVQDQPGDRLARRLDPAAARPGRPGDQAALRASRRPGHPDEAGRPGLQGADRPPRRHPRAAVNANQLAVQLRGLATDNQAQIGDALKQLSTALTFLRDAREAAQRRS